MDKIFDALFSPRVFFRNGHVSPWDSLKVIVLIWFIDVVIMYPTLKSCPFFGNYVLFSLVLLVIAIVYFLWTMVTHMIFTPVKRDVVWRLPFVFLPHIVSGWIVALSLKSTTMLALFIIPIGWSTILEFYFVRATAGRGMFYTLILRAVRDAIFIVAVISFLRGWVS